MREPATPGLPPARPRGEARGRRARVRGRTAGEGRARTQAEEGRRGGLAAYRRTHRAYRRPGKGWQALGHHAPVSSVCEADPDQAPAAETA